MKTVGLDIGGANLKAADSDGNARSVSFPLWKQSEQLPDMLDDLLQPFRPFEVLGVTMTGELADCFTSKSDGVGRILSAVEAVVSDCMIGVWQTGAEFVPPDVAREIPLLVSAANWHAQATWLGRLVPAGGALLIDLGSTTTDIIPLHNGRPVQCGMTDTERLLHGELVYTGVRRTPVAAIVTHLPVGESLCPVAAELFATSGDAWLLTGDLPGDVSDLETADGRPFGPAESRQRLARMVCADASELDELTLEAMARTCQAAQLTSIQAAIRQVTAVQPDRIATVMISGSGRFLARRAVDSLPELAEAELLDLGATFSSRWADAACACAVAQLASERLSGF